MYDMTVKVLVVRTAPERDPSSVPPATRTAPQENSRDGPAHRAGCERHSLAPGIGHTYRIRQLFGQKAELANQSVSRSSSPSHATPSAWRSRRP